MRAFRRLILAAAAACLLIARPAFCEDNRPCIAVMAAFPPELEAIERKLSPDPSQVITTVINGVQFKSAEVNGRRYVFFLTGMSLVNAASSTQLALDRFKVEAVFFSGIAGGVNPELKPGDVAVPARWHYHSEAAYFNETAPGKYELPGWFQPKYRNFGMIFPDDPTVIREGMTQSAPVPSFPADERLLAGAKAAVESMEPMMLGERTCKLAFGGDGVSGTVFCDNAEYRKWVFSVWKADCLDMESAAIAQVCWANKTPCLIIRGLSDLAGGQAGKNQMDDYLRAASDHSAAVLVRVLQAYKP